MRHAFIGLIGAAAALCAADADRWREISVSTDVDAPESLPALRF